jgi:hypothetical protein
MKAIAHVEEQLTFVWVLKSVFTDIVEHFLLHSLIKNICQILVDQYQNPLSNVSRSY